MLYSILRAGRNWQNSLLFHHFRLFSLVGLMFLLLAGTSIRAEGFIEIRDGYFYDQGKEEYFIPHGIAYQVWNPPVYANQTTNQVEYDFREMKRMHVNSLRVEFTWSQIETNEGCYDFENADYLIELAEELDLKLYVLMGYQYPPGWFKTNYPNRMAYHYDQYISATGISDVLNYNCPEAMASYASYVSNMCSRYKDYSCIGGWIVGNEFAYYDLWEPPGTYPNHRFLGFDTNYSLPAFHAFLTNRYEGQIADLNTTWDTSYTDFSEIPMPIAYPVDRDDPKEFQQTGYMDVLLWRQRSIAEFLSAGVGAAKSADTNHLVTYAMVGGIFSGYDANNGCEDARTIVSVCASNGTPVDFWTINNYPWTWTGSEMRSMDYGVAKYKETIGLPVMLSECGLSDNDTIFAETVYRQQPALASLPWEAVMSGAIGAHIFHWNDRPEFFSYNDVLKREGGFGMIHGTRLLKDVYWNILDAYRRMDELHIERLFPGSADPTNDVLTYWSHETDIGFDRYNQELAMIWGAFKRMGFQPGIINEAQFEAMAYTNAPVLFMPRNFQMEPERLDALCTNVLNHGVNLFAEADLPGRYNSYYASNTQWKTAMAELFGLDVTNAYPGYESGAECQEYDDNHRVFVTVVTNTGLLNTNFSTESWKIWHGITNLDATVLATHTGETNLHDAMPALTVKDHGGSWAAFSSFAVGDQISDAEDSPYWEHPWDVRTMVLDAVLKETFGMEPVIELTGSPYARYVASDYRVCSNGTVLISLLNMSGPDHPMTNLVVHAPSLLNGRKVENLSKGGVVTENAGDEVTVSLVGDEFLLLYVYDTGAGGDDSLVNTNKGKIWIENGEGSAPTRVYPTPQWQSVHVGYDIPVEWDWENVMVALERVMPDGDNIRYGLSVSNWVAPGSGSMWVKFPVQPANLDDTNHISTMEGGEYVIAAWLEDMGEVHSRTEIPVEMFWGVRPLSVPSSLDPVTPYDITVKWEDVPSYLDDEGPCPMNRARQWPMENNDDAPQSYRIVLDLMDAQTNILVSTNILTKLGTGEHTFTVTTPSGDQAGNWWRATLVAEPTTYDLIDSFEDRVPGNNSTWFTNDAPMEVWLWGSYNNSPIWWDEGIGIRPTTHGKQSQFTIFKTKNTASPAWSGHSYFFGLEGTNDFSSLAMRSNIWLSMDLCLQDTNEGGTVSASIEMQMLDANNGKKLRYMTYTNHGGFQTFKTRLSDITSNPPWPGNPINWSLVTGFTLNAKHSNPNTAYVCFLDNVRLTGMPVRVGTGGMTNAIYLSNGDLLPGPNPDRPPSVAVMSSLGVAVNDGAPAITNNGTDWGLNRFGTVRTNYYSISVDCDSDLPISGVITSGPGAYSYRVVDMPTNLTPGAAVSNFAIVFEANWEGGREAALTLDCNGMDYVINLDAQIFSANMDNGPAAGGNTLVMTNLDIRGVSITNVLVGGIPASIAGQGACWLSLVMPAHETGWVDVVLQLADGDEWRFSNLYRYNEAGQIGYSYQIGYTWTNLGAGLDNFCYDVVCATNGKIYAGGGFRNAEGLSAQRVAMWDGTNWNALGLGLNNTVVSLAKGPNGELYAGGAFTYAEGSPANRVAVWDGTTWTNLGEGFNYTVNALLYGTDGRLYAGGLFVTSGTLTTRYVAVWDGAAWTNLGEGLDNAVYSLAMDDDQNLYVGGNFGTAGGQSIPYIATWNGSSWSNLGQSVNGVVYSMLVDDDKLYAGGAFSMLGSGVTAPRLAVWNGSYWTNMGSGADDEIRAMSCSDDEQYYVGGEFFALDARPMRRISCWNGEEFEPLGLGLQGNVYGMDRSDDGALYVGGTFTNAGGVNASRIAKWHRPSVTLEGVSPAEGTVDGGTLVSIDGLFIGDGVDITNVTVCGHSVNAIIRQDTTQVVVQTASGEAGLGDVVVYSTHYGMTVKSNAYTYRAPAISVLGTNGVAVENGAVASLAFGTDYGPCTPGAWQTNVFMVVNAGTNDLVVSGVTTGGVDPDCFRVDCYPETVSENETGLWAVAFSPTAGGSYAASLTLLNDSTNFVLNLAGCGAYELSVQTGPAVGGNELIITNLDLTAGDTITNVMMGTVQAVILDGGENWVRITVPAHDAGRVSILVQTDLSGDVPLADAYTYNPAGTIGRTVYGPYGWTNLGDYFNSAIYNVEMGPDGRPYVCGSFTWADGRSCYRISCWDGEHWTNFASGLASTGYGLTFDTNGNLYAAGAFYSAGGYSALRVARWNGSAWTNMGGGLNNTGYAIEMTQAGQLYVGGTFTEADSNVVNRIAHWDGEHWTNMGSGVSGSVYALASDSNGFLYVGGLFTTADGISANRIARWDGTSWTNLGAGMNSTVYVLEIGPDGALYAGGNFTTAGAVSALRVARWDGVSWSNLGGGLNDSVRSISFDEDGTLYAGGYFDEADGVGALRVACWDGTRWTNIGNGVYRNPSSYVRGVVPGENGVLYAGGYFDCSGSREVGNFAMWAPDWILMETGVYPQQGPVEGGQRIVISGEHLGNGSDITNVTLCGAAVAAIVSQSATQVVVDSAAHVTGAGDVAVYSESFGHTVRTNAYEYLTGAPVYMDDLAHVYDGTPCSVTATTDPAGLMLAVTYDGEYGVPAAAGTYVVTGQVMEAGYYGVATATMTVSRASQAITFTPLGDQVVTNVCGLAATADSGFRVGFLVDQGPAVLSADTNLAFTARGQVVLFADQLGNENWQAAPQISNAFRVYGLCTVTVASAYGCYGLTPGAHVLVEDTVLTNGVNGLQTFDTTQFVSVGWALGGHEPGAGVVTSFVMTVTNEAMLTWLWQTNYYLSTTGDLHGAVVPVSGWQTGGAAVDVTAQPVSYYHFDAWQGDVPTGQEAVNPLPIVMTGACSFVAGFAENLTPNTHTPEWWLADYGWTNDFESAVTNDPDGDGVPSWQEFISDTSPTDGVSFLRLTGMSNGELYWSGGTGVTQYLEWCDLLEGGTWQVLATNQPPTAVTNLLLIDQSPGMGCYRIRAER